MCNEFPTHLLCDSSSTVFLISSSAMTDATLAAASATLSSLGSALSLCPIPALQYIPTAAVAIINIAQVRESFLYPLTSLDGILTDLVGIQTVKKNKEDAEALALYIGNLSVAIWRPLQNDQFRLKIEQEQQLDLLIQYALAPIVPPRSLTLMTLSGRWNV